MIALIFDTETNGLVYNRSKKIEKQPYIIEFYGCVYDISKGKVLKEYEALIKPPEKISAEITKITKIDNDMVADKEPFAFHAEAIFAIIEEVPLAIAHNASFDHEVLSIEAERLGRKITWPKLLCTVEATVHLKGFRLSLTALHEMLFGKTFPEAHRAKQDVEALTRCCVELFQRGEI
jgi:DNA polymerase III epsilon subunit-like protein